MNGVKMKLNKIFIVIVTILLLSLVVYAAEQKVLTNTNQMNKSIYNVSYLNATYIFQNGVQVGTGSGGNASFNQSLTDSLYASHTGLTDNITTVNTLTDSKINSNMSLKMNLTGTDGNFGIFTNSSCVVIGNLSYKTLC